MLKTRKKSLFFIQWSNNQKDLLNCFLNRRMNIHWKPVAAGTLLIHKVLFFKKDHLHIRSKNWYHWLAGGAGLGGGQGDNLYRLSLWYLLNCERINYSNIFFKKIKRDNNKGGSNALLFDTANFLPKLLIPKVCTAMPKRKFQRGTPVFIEIKCLSDFSALRVKQLLNIETQIMIVCG